MKKAPQVGETYRHQRTCDKHRPIFYAAASGDFNPIHIDHEVGVQAGLGGVILQGLCTMAWATEAAAAYLQDPGRIRKVRVRFSRPVVPGDEVSFDLKVSSIENGRATLDMSAKNQNGEDVLKGASVEAVVD